jgi:hypothetical protein
MDFSVKTLLPDTPRFADSLALKLARFFIDYFHTYIQDRQKKYS